MAYKPKESGLIRDKAYASEIASTRPLLATRIHCEESSLELDNESIRGGGESMSERFNRQLRGGHAGRNDGDE